MIRRNRRGRFARERVASRWERIMLLSMLGGILLGIAIDAVRPDDEHYTYVKQAIAAEVVPEPQVVQIEVAYSIEQVNEIYRETARKYGVSENQMLTTMRCESRGGVYNIQSEHRYTFSDSARGIYAGEQEKSHGASQIHLPDHPNVTREEAIDPYFAAEFMAKAFKEGHAHWWTCWRNNYM